MRLPASAHTAQPWQIHDIARGFRLEDVWALPTPGGPDDFPKLVALLTSYDPTRSSSRIVRSLFAVRSLLGPTFGWDGPRTDSSPFQPMLQTDTEWAAQIRNRTVHGILHLGWVPDGAGGWRGQLAVLVKPNGAFGRGYLAAIKPFRYLFVYPTLTREIGQLWRTGVATNR